MDNSTGAIVVGIVLPPIIAIFRPYVADNKALGYLLSLVASFIGALILLGINGQLTPESFQLGNLFKTLAIVVTAAQTSYNLIYKPAQVTDRIENKVK